MIFTYVSRVIFFRGARRLNIRLQTHHHSQRKHTYINKQNRREHTDTEDKIEETLRNGE